jgi:hypothetical protein
MRPGGPAQAIPSEEKTMTLNLYQLACLSAALSLSACTTTPKVVDDGAIKDKCECSCKWSTIDGSQAVGKLTVFIAASAALVVATGIGVLAGGLLSQHVSPSTLKYVAGAGFIAIGIWTLLRA